MGKYRGKETSQGAVTRWRVMAAGMAGMVVRGLQTLETSLKFKPAGFADKLHVKCKTNKQTKRSQGYSKIFRSST